MAAETDKVAETNGQGGSEVDEGVLINAEDQNDATGATDIAHNLNDEGLLVDTADSNEFENAIGSENDPATNGNHVEVDVNIHEEGVDDTGLYDDVMAVPTPNISADFSNELNADEVTKGEQSDKPVQNSNNHYAKRVSCYVGNLTWWTTDKELSEAISAIGVSDLIEIKFYENKINGQSKGFAMVTVASDHSFRLLMDKLPKKAINSQDPVVTHFNRHYFNQFEEQARKDMPSTAGGSNPDQQQSSAFHHHHSHHSSNNAAPNSQSHMSHANHNSQPQPLHQSIMNRNRSFGGNNNNVNNSNSSSILSTGLPLARPTMVGVGTAGVSNGPGGLMMPRTSNSQQGLVGNFPNPNPPQNRIPQPNQQSIMGMIPNSIRPNQQTVFNGQGIYSNQRPTAPILNQQNSLMGNRPALNSNQPSGILPIRPNMGHNMAQMNQGLLNNPPRMPNQMNSLSGLPLNSVLASQQSQRSDWDRSSNNSLIGNFNQQPQPNGAIAPNQMLMINQNINNPRNNMNNGHGNPMHQFPYNLGPPGAGPSALQGQMHPSNAILSNQPNPFQSQQSLQSNSAQGFHHSNQSGYNPNQIQSQPGIIQMPGQQPLLNPVGLSQVPQISSMQQTSSQHQMQHSQQQQQPLHHHQHHHPAAASQQQPSIVAQPHMQDTYYHHHHRSAADQQQSAPNSALLSNSHHHAHHPMSQQPMQAQIKLSDIEFQEAFEKNRIVSSTAITRAVQDASFGQYAAAIETLVTAISLIKQSKIAQDERCKLLISSLQDTKKGIEDKYYGSGRSNINIGGSGVISATMAHGGRAESRDRERLKRSRSRDSRDRERERERERDRERDRERERESRSRRGDKHHRSHRERSRDRSRDRRVVSSVTSSGNNGLASGDYYDEAPQVSSRYHRSRH